MRYSVFDQGRGDFAYYDAEDGIDINDDRPVPAFDASIRTPIGVPSIEAGRPLPQGAKFVGRGKEPVGVVTNGQSQKNRSGLLSRAASSIDPSLGALDMSSTSKTVEPAIPFLAATAGAMLGYRFTERSHPVLTFSAIIAGALAGFYASRKVA